MSKATPGDRGRRRGGCGRKASPVKGPLWAGRDVRGGGRRPGRGRRRRRPSPARRGPLGESAPTPFEGAGQRKEAAATNLAKLFSQKREREREEAPCPPPQLGVGGSHFRCVCVPRLRRRASEDSRGARRRLGASSSVAGRSVRVGRQPRAARARADEAPLITRQARRAAAPSVQLAP